MTYYARELTDPAGGALTITTDHQGVWITATEGREEVTVGPFPATTLADDMDGGVTAARVEEEVAGFYTRTDEPNGTPDCEAGTTSDGRDYACTREDGHDGPHIAATVVLNNSVGAVWGELPRPLTPDAINDDMRDRARKALRSHGILGSLVPKVVDEVLTAALTEPPARPEGAKELDEPVGEALRAVGDLPSPEAIRAASDLLASWGVRVTGAES